MTAHDLIDRADIADVWTALGGSPLRHGRGVAFWRGGDGYNVSIDRDKGLWHDHVRGEGGGVLHLVERGNGCDRRTAIQWLADQQGFTLDDNRMSPSERREYAERRRWAEAEAKRLADWRERHIADLRKERNRLWDMGREATRLGHELLVDGAHDSFPWSVVWKHCTDDLRGDEISAEIERLEELDWRQVLALRRSLTGEGVPA